MLYTIGEIIKRFRTEGACYKFNPKTITYMANKLGYRTKRIGGKVGYDSSLMTAISRHFKEALEYDKGFGMKTSQKSLKQPNMGDYYTYNGERDNVDYDWEKNENKIMENNNKMLVGLWLDDKRKDPIYFLNQKEKPRADGKPTSGSIVRNWYKQNMNGVEIQWTAVQNFEQFKNYIETKGVPDFVSLDHDLGDEPSNNIKKNNGERFESGADCALFLVSYCLRSGIPIPKNYIHSANDNKRVYISKAFRLGRMGKDPMQGVDLDNIEEFRVAADRFRARIMNPNVGGNLKSFMKKNGDSELGTADRLARMKGLNDPDKLFKDNKTAFRENREIIRLTESDLHKIIKESIYRTLKENYDII